MTILGVVSALITILGTSLPAIIEWIDENAKTTEKAATDAAIDASVRNIVIATKADDVHAVRNAWAAHDAMLDRIGATAGIRYRRQHRNP